MSYPELINHSNIRSGIAIIFKRRYLHTFLPLPIFEKISYEAVNMQTYIDRIESRGFGMEFSGTTGQILKTWQSPKGSRMSCLSELNLHDNWIYLGSPYNHFAARLPYK